MWYRNETRPVVRREALRYLGQVIDDHWLTKKNVLIEQVVLPFFKPLPLDTDCDLRCQAVQLIIRFLPSSSTDHASNILSLLSQVTIHIIIIIILWCIYIYNVMYNIGIK